MHYDRCEKIVKDPSTISFYDDTKFVLTILYHSISKAMNSNCRRAKRKFSRMSVYYFLDWKTYGLHEFHKNVNAVWAVPYSSGVIIRPQKMPVNITVRLIEDADVKNEELFKMFVLQLKEMVICFEHDVYVTK